MSQKETKQKLARSVEVKVLIPYIIITVFVSIVIGLVAGYFASVSLHSQVRETVAKDFVMVQSKKD